MKKLLYVTLIAFVLIAFATPGLAQEHAAKHKKMEHACKGDHGDCCSMKELKLTDQQKTKVAKMKKAFMAEQKKCKEKMAVLKKELHKLMEAKKPSKKAINKKMDELGKLTTECKKKHLSHQLDFHALLTPEQLKKAKTIHNKACCKQAHLFKAHKEHGVHEAHKSTKEHKDAHECSAKCSATCAAKTKKGHTPDKKAAKAACCKKVKK